MLCAGVGSSTAQPSELDATITVNLIATFCMSTTGVVTPFLCRWLIIHGSIVNAHCDEYGQLLRYIRFQTGAQSSTHYNIPSGCDEAADTLGGGTRQGKGEGEGCEAG
jgi:hypothetical protein